MKATTKYGLAFGIGALMILIGLAATVGSLHLSPETRDFDIDAGNLYFNYIDVGLFAGARLKGSFTVTSGGSINLYIFENREYQNYYNGNDCYYIESASGSSGTFDITVDVGDTYYIVLEHGSGYESMRQTGEVTHQIIGTDFVMIGLGIGLFIGGLMAIVYGWALKKKNDAQTAAFQQQYSSGVTYFQPPPATPPDYQWKPPISPPKV